MMKTVERITATYFGQVDCSFGKIKDEIFNILVSEDGGHEEKRFVLLRFFFIFLEI